jgi:hypothetical protein
MNGEAGAPRSAVPSPPWSVSYHDGSGNAFQFEPTSTGDSARFSYSPVTPEQSSSGMYSGGEPASGTLDAERVRGLWKRLHQLEAETTLHAEERGKGTGSFRIVTSRRERSFIVLRGDLLRELDEFLAGLKQHPPR